MLLRILMEDLSVCDSIEGSASNSQVVKVSDRVADVEGLLVTNCRGGLNVSK